MPVVQETEITPTCRVSVSRRVRLMFVVLILTAGCSRDSTDSQKTPPLVEDQTTFPESPAATVTELPGIVRWATVAPLTHDVAIMESVFWEPADTDSLRARIFATPEIRGSSVLEIGTGSGLISLCCLQAGAALVIATDLNPNAVANVRFNALNSEGIGTLEARLVPRRDTRAWSVIKPDERFHFIISNPPWENENPKSVEEFALYDPNFVLLDSLVRGAREKLLPNGRMWLAYGCVTAIRRIQQVAQEEHLECLKMDERSLEDLPEDFLPGMLLEITIPAPQE